MKDDPVYTCLCLWLSRCGFGFPVQSNHPRHHRRARPDGGHAAAQTNDSGPLPVHGFFLSLSLVVSSGYKIVPPQMQTDCVRYTLALLRLPTTLLACHLPGAPANGGLGCSANQRKCHINGAWHSIYFHPYLMYLAAGPLRAILRMFLPSQARYFCYYP